MTERPIEASWLALRYRADARAREHSLPLVRALAEHLMAAKRDDGAKGPPLHPPAPDSSHVTVVDVGAGTGANLRWLGPHLDQALASAIGQDWHLLDHDAALLEAVQDSQPTWLRGSTRHTGSVATVRSLLDTTTQPRAVSCSALLDLLTAAQIEDLVAATVAGADAALWSLSVTGDVALTPAYPEDELVAERFNHDQQRGTSTSTGLRALAGPDGWRVAANAFTERGWRVRTASTPWILGAGEEPLTRRLLTERAAAAHSVSRGARDQGVIETWLARRLEEVDLGRLHVRIDHADLMALPVKSISEQTSSPS